MRNILFTFVVFNFIMLPNALSQKERGAIKEVEKILIAQQGKWNQGDIEGFMEDYWKSDKLQFIGSSGVTYGWQQTKDNYYKRYPDRATMGHLTFTIINTTQLSKKSMMLTGKFHLKRDMGDAEGHFLLVWKKIDGKWVIIADHTS